ncbi:hypothetical protein Tco_0529340 [Tanacetum coccineum]
MYPPPHLSQLQISHSSIPPSQQYQSHQTLSVLPIAYNSPQSLTQPLTEFPQMDSGLAFLMFNQGDDPIAYLNKEMAFLIAATIQDSRVTMQQVQGRQRQSYAGEGHMARQCTQSKRPRNIAWFKEKAMLAGAQESEQILDEEQLTFLTEDLDAYDSDYDDVSNAKAVLMANLSNYGSDIISEVPYLEHYHTDMDNQSMHAMQGFEQTPVVEFTDNEIDRNIIPYSQYLQETQQAAIQDTNFHVIDDEEALILEEVSRSKMLAKQNDPMSKEKKVDTTPINYLQTSYPNTDQSASSPGKIKAHKELPKLSLVNTSLKKLSYHLGQFNIMVKKRITPDAIIEGEWGFEHTKTVFLNEIIPFLKTLKDIFNVFYKDFLNEVTEVQTVFNQMEADVQQYFIEKQCFEIHKKEPFLENDRLLQKLMSHDVMICVMKSTAVFDDVNVEIHSTKSYVRCLDLDAELLNKQNVYNDLSKRYSQLEKHCISLELTMQLNQEIFHKDSLSNNQNALEIP